MQANDSDALEALLDDGVVLHSPVVSLDQQRTDRDDAGAARLDENRAAARLLRTNRLVGQFSCPFSGTVLGRPVDIVAILDVAAAGLIRDVTVYICPYSGLAAFAAEGGSALTRPAGLLPTAVVALGLRFLAVLLRLGDKIGTRLLFKGIRSPERTCQATPVMSLLDPMPDIAAAT